jgi:hypothetical protein
MAQLFRHLVTLCDMKIAVLNAIDENPCVKMLHTPEGTRKLLDWKPGIHFRSRTKPMLAGDDGASNTDPNATGKSAGNHWVVTGPRIMGRAKKQVIGIDRGSRRRSNQALHVVGWHALRTRDDPGCCSEAEGKASGHGKTGDEITPQVGSLLGRSLQYLCTVREVTKSRHPQNIPCGPCSSDGFCRIWGNEVLSG